MDYKESATTLYTPIPVGQAQTRLLRLHHGPASSPLLADLVVIDIKSDDILLHEEQRPITYTALSYTWGNGPFSHDITINGVPWRIKEGLFDFLHQYRSDQSSEKELYIWIDAVVINQNDADEKSRQVATMIEFYEKALHVQVWLGKSTRNTKEAIGFLQDLLKDTERQNQSISKNALAGLQDLYTRAWPTRMWIRQEVWAAKAISIQCGSFILSLDEFKAGVTFSRSAGDEVESPAGSSVSGEGIYDPSRALTWLHQKLKVPESHLAAISFLVQRRAGEQYPGDRAQAGLGYKAMDNGGRKDILWLLYESANYESTDIRDRIYALIGMCDDPTIEIDYRKTPAEVFTSFTRHIMMRAGTLDHVLDLSCKYGRDSDLSLPSWVPDWRSLDLVNYKSSDQITKYDLGSSFDSEKPQVLTLHGFQLGTAALAKAKKSRAAKKCNVRVDWNRIRSKVQTAAGDSDFLAKVPGDQTLSVESLYNKTDPRPGDVLIAARGSDLYLVLLRPRTESGDGRYSFVNCVFRREDREVRKAMMEHGMANGLLERFDVV